MTIRMAHARCAPLAFLCIITTVHGGATLDGTLGTGGSFSGNMSIPASAGRQAGGNLFHSFGTLSILAGESLHFTSLGSNAPIANVISRVTGGSASNINGVLGSTISGANLFLINPSGITFGPTANLQVTGSFHASTANYLQFADGSRFDANPHAITVLTIASPSAFGFLGPAPASITLSGSPLRVPTGKALGLIGGNVSIGDGTTITANGGTVNLVSIASSGEVPVTAGPFDASAFARLGAVSITGGSAVDVSEAPRQSTAGGTVYIRGGTLVLAGSALLARASSGAGGGVDLRTSGDIQMTANTRLDAGSSGQGQATGVEISAGGAVFMDNASIASEARGSGDSGNIRINASHLTLAGGSSISTDTHSTAHGGDIAIAASGTVALDTSYITSATFDRGSSGNILVNASNLGLANNSIISTHSQGAGRGGNISIAATGTMSIDRSVVTSGGFANGDAGNIQVSASNLALANRAYLATTTFATGRGGDIFIAETGNVSLNDSLITSEALGDGHAGSVRIHAGGLALFNNAKIASSGAPSPWIGRGGSIAIDASGAVSLDDNSRIQSIAGGPGGTGSIGIRAGSLALARGSTVSTDTQSTARGGDISIAATGAVDMDASYVTSTAFDRGDAGNIQVSASNLALANSSIISTHTESSGRGGNISIAATGNVSMNRSFVTSSALGSGDSGNLQATSANLTLANGSYISTAAFSAARGGDIEVAATGMISMANSYVASGAFGEGVAGNILISAGALNLAHGAQINAQSTDRGNAGDIRIMVRDSVVLTHGSAITAEALLADGGEIDISAGFKVYLANSRITTAVGTGSGNGGNITIDPVFVILDNSQIIADAFGGRGGNIAITAQHFIADSASVVVASSVLSIVAPILDLGGSLIALPSAFLDASTLLANQCAARIAGNSSSLVLAGRGGIPMEPDGWLSGLGAIHAPEAGQASTAALRRIPASHLPKLATGLFGECAR